MTEKTFSVLKTNLLHQGRKFRFVEEELELPNGKHSRVEKLEHPGAVVILPVRDDGTLILIEQFRPAIRDSILEFPAGTLEPGEQPLECAKRELVEEIGLSAADWVSLGSFFPAPGFCNEVQHFFAARNFQPAFAEQDADEIITPVEMPRPAFEAALRENRIRDGKSLAIFALACAKGVL
ncbi:MAG: NUDIX hydrolase [Bdellovibrionota bacterium]